MDRRLFLADMSRLAVVCAGLPNEWVLTARPRFADDPFTLGVASGDPTTSGAVLWTRLAPDPLAPDGGMPGNRPIVAWEVAHDEQFTRIVRSGRYTAAPELGYSVHVDVDGLEPDRWYYYRFLSGLAVSPVGRVRTTPAPGALTPLRLGSASCQNYEQGHFTALDHLAQEQCDLVTHLGDYIYEYGGRDGLVRRHHASEIRTLDDYRARYGQYRSDTALQKAHAMCPWFVTWDDHEVDNNYANEFGENRMESLEQMRQRRAIAYQAWWENQAVRVPRARSWADLDIRRTVDWGALARFWVLDTRQYRDDQACDDGNRIVPCGDWNDPQRTILGAEQESWLVEGLGRQDTRWQVLAQQVMMAPFDSAPGPDREMYMDSWSGYPHSRDRVLAAIAERARNRTVVLTGDIHSNWVNELSANFERPEGDPVAAEFVVTSISSGGDGRDAWESVPANMSENPHLKWHTARRGYHVSEVRPDAWHTTYREVPVVTTPGAPVRTVSEWRTENGRPGITRVS
jgi:alkaline phosphatase D